MSIVLPTNCDVKIANIVSFSEGGDYDNRLDKSSTVLMVYGNFCNDGLASMVCKVNNKTYTVNVAFESHLPNPVIDVILYNFSAYDFRALVEEALQEYLLNNKS